MTRVELLLAEDAVFEAGDDLEIEIRTPWYRSLPLTSVRGLEVTIDGKQYDSNDLRLRIDGVDYSLDDLGERFDKTWFIQDAAVVTVPGAGRPVGVPLDVEVAIELSFPYIIIEGVGPLQRRTVAHRSTTVQEAAR